FPYMFGFHFYIVFPGLCLGNGKYALRMGHYADAERQTDFSRRASDRLLPQSYHWKKRTPRIGYLPDTKLITIIKTRNPLMNTTNDQIYIAIDLHSNHSVIGHMNQAGQYIEQRQVQTKIGRASCRERG